MSDNQEVQRYNLIYNVGADGTLIDAYLEEADDGEYVKYADFCTSEAAPAEKVMRHELENIYMLARMKRAVRHRYPEGFPEVPAEPIGPKSNDADQDLIIRFCEQAGLKPTILRTMEFLPTTPDAVIVDNDDKGDPHP